MLILLFRVLLWGGALASICFAVFPQHKTVIFSSRARSLVVGWAWFFVLMALPIVFLRPAFRSRDMLAAYMMLATGFLPMLIYAAAVSIRRQMAPVRSESKAAAAL